jgi:hypothetical protein
MKKSALLSLLLGLATVGGSAACKTTQAATAVERPNLDVPPPPPRVIESAPAIEPPAADPIGEVPAAPAPGSATKPRPQRDPATAKPETKPDAPPETPVPAPTVSAPPPQLRMPGLTSGPAMAGEIRATLDRAHGMLAKIDYGRLNKPRQGSYDTAKRFHAEGEKELRAANYVLAKELAEKAERLAKELQGR